MRSTCLFTGVALAALAGVTPGAPAQPRAPAPQAARPQASCPVPNGWSAARFGGADDPFEGRRQIVNGIAILPGGEQRWNGSPLERETMGSYLRLSGMMAPPPILVLWPDDGAGCDDLAAAAAFVAARFACSPDTCRLADAAPARQYAPPAPPRAAAPAAPAAGPEALTDGDGRAIRLHLCEPGRRVAIGELTDLAGIGGPGKRRRTATRGAGARSLSRPRGAYDPARHRRAG